MNKKILSIFVGALLALPFASATQYFQALDLYYLLVENVFGSLALAGVGIVILLFLIGIAGRMSKMTLFSIIILFSVTYIIGMYGAVSAMFVFVGSLFYCISSIYKYFTS